MIKIHFIDTVLLAVVLYKSNAFPASMDCMWGAMIFHDVSYLCLEENSPHKE